MPVVVVVRSRSVVAVKVRSAGRAGSRGGKGGFGISRTTDAVGDDDGDVEPTRAKVESRWLR